MEWIKLWLRRMICKIRFHDLETVFEFHRGISKKLWCRRCKRFFGIHYEAKAFVPWSGDIEAVYRNNYQEYNDFVLKQRREKQ